MCENSDLSKVLAHGLDSFVIPSGHVALSTSGITMIMSGTLPDGRTERSPSWHLSDSPVNAYDNPMNIYDASAAKSWLSRHSPEEPLYMGAKVVWHNLDHEMGALS